jgi:hypothetical protein
MEKAKIIGGGGCKKAYYKPHILPPSFLTSKHGLRSALTILTAVVLLISSFTFSSCKNCKDNPGNPATDGDKNKDNSVANGNRTSPSNTDGDKDKDNSAADGNGASLSKVVDKDDDKDLGGGSSTGGELTAEQLLAAKVRDNLNLARKANEDNAFIIAKDTVLVIGASEFNETRVTDTAAADMAQIFREVALKVRNRLQQLKKREQPKAIWELSQAEKETEMWAQAVHWAMRAGQKDKAQEDAKNARNAAQEVQSARVGPTLPIDGDDGDGLQREVERHRANAKGFAKTAYQETGLKWEDF